MTDNEAVVYMTQRALQAGVLTEAQADAVFDALDKGTFAAAAQPKFAQVVNAAVATMQAAQAAAAALATQVQTIGATSTTVQV